VEGGLRPGKNHIDTQMPAETLGGLTKWNKMNLPWKKLKRKQHRGK